MTTRLLHRWGCVLMFAGVLTAPAFGTPAEQTPVALQALGKRLFFDARLSRGGDVSCASCHEPDLAFSDGKPTAIGTGGQIGTRNTPSLISLGDGPFFWEGRASRLESVMAQPFTNLAEMGLSNQEELLGRLSSNKLYVDSFVDAFHDSKKAISISNVELALASYVGSLAADSGNSAYDRYSSGADPSALSPQAKHGLELFGGEAGCIECHRIAGGRAQFSDGHFHPTLANPNLTRALPPAAVQIEQSNQDATKLGGLIESDPITSELGRFLVTHDPKDIGAFRTPSLRNVALTAPYMHDGSVKTLREALNREIYYRNLLSNRPNTLTEQDRQDLLSFLEALSDARESQRRIVPKKP